MHYSWDILCLNEQPQEFPTKPKYKQDVLRMTAPSAIRDQKKQTLAECGHFKQWSASWYNVPWCRSLFEMAIKFASGHQISGWNGISSHFLNWVLFLVQAYHGCTKKPSITIFNNNLLHGTVHLSAKFQADSWYPQWVRVETSFLRSGKNLPRKISMELSKIGQERIFQIVVCFMVLCIIPPDFRPITDS